MVETRPTGRTPHETVEIVPDPLDCGHPPRPGRYQLGTEPGPDGLRRRSYRCRECGQITWRDL